MAAELSSRDAQRPVTSSPGLTHPGPVDGGVHHFLVNASTHDSLVVISHEDTDKRRQDGWEWRRGLARRQGGPWESRHGQLRAHWRSLEAFHNHLLPLRTPIVTTIKVCLLHFTQTLTDTPLSLRSLSYDNSRVIFTRRARVVAAKYHEADFQRQPCGSPTGSLGYGRLVPLR